MSTLGLPILTYHSLDDSGAVTATEPSRFTETIERLIGAGFRGVDLVTWIAQGRPDVPKGFAVTFDDGFRSILSGCETLERHRIPAAVFLVTDHVGGMNDWPRQPRGIPHSELLDWSELAELSRRGFTFGAHSATHPRLDRITARAIGAELWKSQLVIESRLQQSCGLLTYPYGISTCAVRERVGYRYDAAFGTRLAMANAASPLFDLPRIDAYYLKSFQVLDRLISGRLQPWLRMRRSLRTARRFARSLFTVTP